MDILKNIILTFDKDDVKEFKSFINRKKQKQNRKDLDLFLILLDEQDVKPKVITEQLYGEHNFEAYHTLRRKLFKHIRDYIITKRLQDDNTKQSTIAGSISLSQYLFDKAQFEMAWEFIIKAENEAITAESFQILHSIYNIQIEHFGVYCPLSLNEIILKRKENEQRVKNEEKALIANALIKEKLLISKQDGTTFDFDKEIENILKQLNIGDYILNHPKLLFNFISITRSNFIANKNYYAFEPIIKKYFEKIKSNIADDPKYQHIYVELLYFLSHALYRNKKFTEAIKYLQEMDELLQKFNKTLYQRFNARYSLLLAACESFTGNSKSAAQRLNHFLENSKKINHDDYLKAVINRCIYLTHIDEVEKANQHLILYLDHSDKWYDKIMGKEWVLKKNIIELMLQYELENYDLCLNRIRSIERSYGSLFKLAKYERVKIYLKFVKDIINDPFIVKDKKWLNKIEGAFEWIPLEQEDLQAISFYSWFKSKLGKNSQYEVLLSLINNS